MFKKISKLNFLLASALFSSLTAVNAQSLEMTNTGGPSGQGPSVNPQTVVLQQNTNNPSGNTFVPYTPALSAQFSLSDIQYTNGLTFGGTASTSSATPSAFNYYDRLGIGGGNNNNYTAAKENTPGTGIDINSNYGITVFANNAQLHTLNLPAGSYYYGKITVTYSHPVTDPVIHLSNLGGTATLNGDQYFYTDFVLNDDYKMTILSSNGRLAQDTVTKKIYSNAVGSGGNLERAYGSVLINGSNISSVTFSVYLRGIITSGTPWAQDNSAGGDLFQISTSFGNIIALPITLTSFTATEKNCQSQIAFHTATEDEVRTIDIQHSEDGVTFEKIETITPKGDNSDYTYLDKNPSAGDNFYRLQIIDINGSVSYSNVVSVKTNCAASKNIVVFPNPTSDNITIRGMEENQPKEIRVTNLLGQVVASYKVKAANESISLGQLPNAMYIVQIIQNKEIVSQQKIIKK